MARLNFPCRIKQFAVNTCVPVSFLCAFWKPQSDPPKKPRSTLHSAHYTNQQTSCTSLPLGNCNDDMVVRFEAIQELAARSASPYILTTLCKIEVMHIITKNSAIALTTKLHQFYCVTRCKSVPYTQNKGTNKNHYCTKLMKILLYKTYENPRYLKGQNKYTSQSAKSVYTKQG